MAAILSRERWVDESRTYIRLKTHKRHPIAHLGGWDLVWVFVSMLKNTDRVITGLRLIYLHDHSAICKGAIAIRVPSAVRLKKYKNVKYSMLIKIVLNPEYHGWIQIKILYCKNTKILSTVC